MNRRSHRRSALAGQLRRVHLVDKCLMVFLAVLLVQSAVNLLCPAGAGLAGDIDVIVRTSAAAIFGYLLSANFTRLSLPGQAREAAPAHTLEAEAGAPVSGAPVGRIGFDAGEAGTPLSQTEVPVPPESTPDPEETVSSVQIACAAAVGLFCLAALLALRNLSALGLLPLSDGAADTVVQFRDFVSGCVGFLIGCPTRTGASTSSS
ncbi:hypothetical protein [uncultured Oscillibacter sp.]|uniref:hypothetical protein n=1 Tax=uncultured Oscillibacter sp. TaxID=876091 RepID=UPI0025DD6AAF|nr:hypothetical protein [uncultured Oscillibacter sp.]